MNEITTGVLRYVPVIGVLAGVSVGLALINWVLRRRWQDDPDAQFRFQLIMLGLTFSGGLAVIVALPINDTLRGQLLSLIGILLSAAIALSSTTFIGNIMAGIMLKAIKSVRPGDFMTVADVVGRVTEMDLLHTEIQTEDRDLVTVPNLYIVTQPMRVVRASGTIVSAEVSLGYDIQRRDVAKLLTEAANRAELKDCFVQVRGLGDFSVVYRVAGMLEEVNSLISARSRLRENMLDVLHEAGIEIVSPNFMNTRAIAENTYYVPKPAVAEQAAHIVSAEDLAFDKAEQASSVEDIRKQIEALDAELERLKKADDKDYDAKEGEIIVRKHKLVAELKVAEEQREAADQADESGRPPSVPPGQA